MHFGPGRGPRDIANFVCTSLDPPERRAQEKALLTRWNDDLARSGSERPDDTNERGRTLFDAMLTRALTAVDDLDAAAVVADRLR